MRETLERTLLVVSALLAVGCVVDDGYGDGNGADCPASAVWRGDAIIHDAYDLHTLSGYTRVEGSVVINNTPLSYVDPLDCLTSVGGNLTIVNNPRLVDVEGLRHVMDVDEAVHIWTNPHLGTLHGLRGLRATAGIVIIDNPSLHNIDGVRGARGMTRFSVIGNQALTTVDGMAMRRAGAIQISDNAALHTIDLGELSSVSEDLGVAKNKNLRSLALPRLTSIGGDVLVYDNPQLPRCALDAIVDRLVDFTGSVTASGNDEMAPCAAAR